MTPHAAGHTLAHSSEELQIQIHQARERGLLAPGEERFMLGAMELGQLRVREIMVPRPDVHALPVEADFDEVLALFATTQRSRLARLSNPRSITCSDSCTSRTCFGFCSIASGAPRRTRPCRLSICGALLREVLIVPESKLASELLVEMRTRRTAWPWSSTNSAASSVC